jgi:hypothetical protein
MIRLREILRKGLWPIVPMIRKDALHLCGRSGASTPAGHELQPDTTLCLKAPHTFQMTSCPGILSRWQNKGVGPSAGSLGSCRRRCAAFFAAGTSPRCAESQSRICPMNSSDSARSVWTTWTQKPGITRFSARSRTRRTAPRPFPKLCAAVRFCPGALRSCRLVPAGAGRFAQRSLPDDEHPVRH